MSKNREIGSVFRMAFGNSIPEMAAQVKSRFNDINQRRRGADSQELTFIDILRKKFPKTDPERFLPVKSLYSWANTISIYEKLQPSNKDYSLENAYYGDILVLNKDKTKIALGIDIKMSSKDSKSKYFGPIQFSSILDFNSFDPPPKISKELIPENRIFMCFRTSGEYGFVDPKEAFDALLSKKAKLIRSTNRCLEQYPQYVYDDVASYVDKVEVIWGRNEWGRDEIWPQDFIHHEYQDKLMF